MERMALVCFRKAVRQDEAMTQNRLLFRCPFLSHILFFNYFFSTVL